MTARTVATLCAFAIAGCGGGGTASTASHPAGVSLDLKGGGNASVSACGSSHHYAVFPAGRAIRFSGDVRPVPSGRWKVKLKIKVCRGGSFEEAQKIGTVRDKHTGHFAGAIAAPRPGRYFARASLYVGGALRQRSDKRHYVVR